MSLTIKDKDGKKYIKGRGKFFYLSKDKSGALNQIPSGHQLIRINGRIFLKKKS